MGETSGTIKIPEDLTEAEVLNFMYLQAVYSLNQFYGRRINPSAAHFETNDEKICAEIIRTGGNIVDMHKAGADALYCALLSDPLTDKDILLKTVDCYIPF
jgi:hypothetical protein